MAYQDNGPLSHDEVKDLLANTRALSIGRDDELTKSEMKNYILLDSLLGRN